MAGKVDTAAIVAFTNARVNTQVGGGECFDLATAALAQAGAKVAADFGVITPDADYVWGAAAPLTAVQAGDVLQYRNYEAVQATETTITLPLPGGGEVGFGDVTSVSIPRPHHTAIAMGAAIDGQLKIMEQNVDRGNGLQRTVGGGVIFIASKPPKTTTTTRKMTIDRALIDRIKADQPDPGGKDQIENAMRPHLGSSVEAKVETTETLEVSGTLKAYRPQPK